MSGPWEETVKQRQTQLLKQHMATQHSDNPPTFTCQCGKVFKSQRGLKSHEMLHTGGIKCGLCPFEGTHGEQMRAHCRSQHGLMVPIKLEIVAHTREHTPGSVFMLSNISWKTPKLTWADDGFSAWSSLSI